MTDELQGILAAAAAENTREPAADTPPRRPMQLHAVAGRQAVAAVVPTHHITAAEGMPQNADEAGQLGRYGLRLGFWLCGFHEALLERERNGGTLTERETSLIHLSRRDFAAIRPLVVAMAVERLHAVVSSPGVVGTGGPTEAGNPGPVEVFAIETLRNLATRARALLREEGPDAAMSMFGAGAGTAEPLAIFQAVFGTAHGVIEAFEPLMPAGARSLSRIVAALDSELDRT